jgi:hypothetical protein
MQSRIRYRDLVVLFSFLGLLLFFSGKAFQKSNSFTAQSPQANCIKQSAPALVPAKTAASFPSHNAKPVILLPGLLPIGQLISVQNRRLDLLARIRISAPQVLVPRASSRLYYLLFSHQADDLPFSA